MTIELRLLKSEKVDMLWFLLAVLLFVLQLAHPLRSSTCGSPEQLSLSVAFGGAFSGLGICKGPMSSSA